MKLGGCKDKQPNRTKFIEQTKNWFFADSTSYWIYRINNTYEDSIIGKSLLRFESNKSGRFEIIDDWYTFKFKSKSMGYIEYFGGSFAIDMRSNYGNTGGLVIYDATLMNKYYKDEKYGKYRVLDTIIPVYKLNGQTYDTTLVWRIWGDAIQQTDTGVYYFTKGVGFTRIIDKGRKIDKQLVRFKYVKSKDLS